MADFRVLSPLHLTKMKFVFSVPDEDAAIAFILREDGIKDPKIAALYKVRQVDDNDRRTEWPFVRDCGIAP